MKRISYLLAAVVALAGSILYMARAAEQADTQAAPIYGIKIPAGYRDWKLVSLAHEAGNNNDLRAVLGNDVAIKAYREGKPPFPDSSIIARLAWSYDSSEENNKVFGRTQSFVAGARSICSSWSKTRENTQRRAAGVSLNSKTANLLTRHCSRLVSPAMHRPKRKIRCSLITRNRRELIFILHIVTAYN